jgi:hypothetical protein
MTTRDMEMVIAITFGGLALLCAVYYRNLWVYLRLARGATRRLLWAFALLVSMVALAMGAWAVVFILWPAPRAGDIRFMLYVVLWLEHLGLAALIGYLYGRLVNNGNGH